MAKEAKNASLAILWGGVKNSIFASVTIQTQ